MYLLKSNDHQIQQRWDKHGLSINGWSYKGNVIYSVASQNLFSVFYNLNTSTIVNTVPDPEYKHLKVTERVMLEKGDHRIVRKEWSYSFGQAYKESYIWYYRDWVINSVSEYHDGITKSKSIKAPKYWVELITVLNDINFEPDPEFVNEVQKYVYSVIQSKNGKVVKVNLFAKYPTREDIADCIHYEMEWPANSIHKVISGCFEQQRCEVVTASHDLVIAIEDLESGYCELADVANQDFNSNL